MATDFILAKPEVQKKFEEAKKKNSDLTAKEFIQSGLDQKAAKEYEKFGNDTKLSKIVEENEKETRKVAGEFGEANEKLKKEFR